MGNEVQSFLDYTQQYKTFFDAKKVDTLSLSDTPVLTSLPATSFKTPAELAAETAEAAAQGNSSSSGGKNLRNLQTTTEGLSFQQKMQTIFTSYKFPKMMIVHRSVE